ncbi:MAG: hypothetical protein U0836_19480 [Pirellulales bacterium]
MSRKTCTRLAITGLLVYVTGCSSFDLKKGIPWGEGLDGEFSAPMKVVPVWTDTTMYQAGRVPVRGFGGRLFFHKDEKGDPVKVKGTLEVYAFDEAGRRPSDSRPTRKFVFSPEQFQKHYSKSELGPSYSVFIPWDELGGPQQQLTLITRFIPEGAPLVISEPSKQSLPGQEPTQMAQQAIPSRPFGPPQAGVPEMGAPPMGPMAPMAQQVAPASYQAPAYQPAPANQAVQQPAFPVQQAGHQAPAAYAPTPADAAAAPQQMTTLTIPVRGQRLNAMPRTNMPLAPPVQQSSAITQSPSAIGFGQVQRIQGTDPPTLAPTPPEAHSGPGRHRALGAPLAPLPRDRAQWPRPHVGWPSSPAGSPAQAPASGSGSPAPAVNSTVSSAG